MSNTFFIIGGARSGKSSYALELGSGFPGRKGFIATAEAFDEEMKERISLHQKTRPLEWQTIEEPVDLGKRLQGINSLYDVVIVDCLTLWLSNMLGREEDSEPPKGNKNPPLPPFRKGAGFPLLRSIATGRGGFDRGFSDEPSCPFGAQRSMKIVHSRRLSLYTCLLFFNLILKRRVVQWKQYLTIVVG